MAHKELTTREQFQEALAVKDRYIFIYAHEGEIPVPAQENAKRFAGTTDAYGVDVSKLADAKQHLKIEKVPTALVYKNGEEVKRVEDMNPESMKEVEQLLSA